MKSLALTLALALAATPSVASARKADPKQPKQEKKAKAKDAPASKKKAAKDGEKADSEPSGYDVESDCYTKGKFNSGAEVGTTLGNPMGLDLKFFITKHIALKSVLGVTFSKDLMGTLDVLFPHYAFREERPFTIWLSTGVGGLIGGKDTYDDFTAAVGIPLAFDMRLGKSSLIMSATARPGLALTPDYDFSFTWHLGIRYNFKSAKRKKKRERCIAGKANGYAAAYSDSQKDLGDARKGLGEAKKDLGEARKDLGEARKDLQETTTQLGETEKALAAKAKEIEEKENDLAKIKEEQEAQKVALAEAEKEIEKSQQQRQELENKVAAMQNDIKNTADPEEIRELKEKLEELQSQKDALQGDISEQRRDKCVASGGAFKNDKCNCPDGRVSRNDVCVCAQSREVWVSNKNTCICSKGFYRNKDTQVCTPCRYLKSNGYCRWTPCTDQERRKEVDTRDGVVVYTCVNRCSKQNEVWSNRSKSCICQEGYKRVGQSCKSRN